MLGNLHTHTSFSDGSDVPEAYIKEAEKQGFDVLGFSDHAPIPFPNEFAIQEGGLAKYCATIEEFKKRDPDPRIPDRASRIPDPSSLIAHHSSELEVLLGLEFDFLPDNQPTIPELRNQYPFDYIIGSVHLVTNPDVAEPWFIDGPKQASYDAGLDAVFQGDIREGVTAYWRQIQLMIVQEKPDIIGHLDKIKMHNKNRYFKEHEDWYVRLVDETLELIHQHQIVVEVNTRGIYKKRCDTLFPGPYILRKMASKNIPITISSDAHRPEEISYCFDLARSIVGELGYGSTWMLTSRGWKEEKIA
jgi:histidinol-phosphatase (PHP family)